MPAIEVFRQRSYQRASRHARAKGCKRFIKLWHRRAGKDRDGMAFILEESMQRIGNYVHLFPSLNQGRRDVWNNTIQEIVNGKEVSRPMMSMFPKEIASRRNEAEMLTHFDYGGTYQIMGADDDDAIDRLRGFNPVGILISEYAHGGKMQKAWNTVIPVLAENGGWAMFAYTPNGINHGYDLWNAAVNDPEHWFTQKLTIEDTFRDAVGESGGPVVPMDEIIQLRKNGVREEFIQQEFWCSFTGYQHGTIYGDLMMKADAEGRIRDLPYIVNLPVGVILDLGQSETDNMSVWFYQLPDGNAQTGRIFFIDYWEKSKADISQVARMLREEKPYVYGRVVLPWDGQSAAHYLWQLGFKNVHVSERTKSVRASLDICRTYFGRCFWDTNKCAVGIKHLREYKREFDDDARVFTGKPIHNEASHGADAFRTGVEGGFEPLLWQSDLMKPVNVIHQFDPREIG